MSDPAELPGLAHFCEHMLFLGTEKVRCKSHLDLFLVFSIIFYFSIIAQVIIEMRVL